VAEKHVAACLHANHVNKSLWIPAFSPGQVKEVAGGALAGRTLDAVGYCPRDRSNPSAGLIPFGVEVKNIRSWIYPWDNEMWDLLTALGPRPDVLPVLVARRIHPVAFNFVFDIGAFARQTREQYFAWSGTEEDSFTPDAFAEVVEAFGFADAIRLEKPDSPSYGEPLRNHSLVAWFGETLSQYAAAQAAKWEVAAPIVAKFPDLRSENLSAADRRGLWMAFCKEFKDSGLYVRGGWAPTDFESS